MATTTTTTFARLGLSQWLIDTLNSLDIAYPTDVQAACIPAVLCPRRRFVVGCSKTGSGKTAAFALPILQSLATDLYGPYALVLTPTRELAIQIAEQFRVFGLGIGARDAVVVGGDGTTRPSFIIFPHL